MAFQVICLTVFLAISSSIGAERTEDFSGLHKPKNIILLLGRVQRQPIDPDRSSDADPIYFNFPTRTVVKGCDVSMRNNMMAFVHGTTTCETCNKMLQGNINNMLSWSRGSKKTTGFLQVSSARRRRQTMLDPLTRIEELLDSVMDDFLQEDGRPALDKVLEISIKDAQRNNKNGFILVVSGAEMNDPMSLELNAAVIVALKSCNPLDTLIVVMGSCGTDGTSVPIFAIGPGNQIFGKTEYVWEIPLKLAKLLKLEDKEGPGSQILSDYVSEIPQELAKLSKLEDKEDPGSLILSDYVSEIPQELSKLSKLEDKEGPGSLVLGKSDYVSEIPQEFAKLSKLEDKEAPSQMTDAKPLAEPPTDKEEINFYSIDDARPNQLTEKEVYKTSPQENGVKKTRSAASDIAEPPKCVKVFKRLDDSQDNILVQNPFNVFQTHKMGEIKPTTKIYNSPQKRNMEHSGLKVFFDFNSNKHPVLRGESISSDRFLPEFQFGPLKYGISGKENRFIRDVKNNNTVRLPVKQSNGSENETSHKNDSNANLNVSSFTSDLTKQGKDIKRSSQVVNSTVHSQSPETSLKNKTDNLTKLALLAEFFSVLTSAESIASDLKNLDSFSDLLLQASDQHEGSNKNIHGSEALKKNITISPILQNTTSNKGKDDGKFNLGQEIIYSGNKTNGSKNGVGLKNISTKKLPQTPIKEKTELNENTFDELLSSEIVNNMDLFDEYLGSSSHHIRRTVPPTNDNIYSLKNTSNFTSQNQTIGHHNFTKRSDNLGSSQLNKENHSLIKEKPIEETNNTNGSAIHGNLEKTSHLNHSISASGNLSAESILNNTSVITPGKKRQATKGVENQSIEAPKKAKDKINLRKGTNSDLKTTTGVDGKSAEDNRKNESDIEKSVIMKILKKPGKPKRSIYEDNEKVKHFIRSVLISSDSLNHSQEQITSELNNILVHHNPSKRDNNSSTNNESEKYAEIILGNQTYDIGKENVTVKNNSIADKNSTKIQNASGSHNTKQKNKPSKSTPTHDSSRAKQHKKLNSTSKSSRKGREIISSFDSEGETGNIKNITKSPLVQMDEDKSLPLPHIENATKPQVKRHNDLNLSEVSQITKSSDYDSVTELKNSTEVLKYGGEIVPDESDKRKWIMKATHSYIKDYEEKTPLSKASTNKSDTKKHISYLT